MEKIKNYDVNLEALRGFCATMVLVHHCIVYSDKLNGGRYIFTASVIPYSPSGHLMVMIFFMLSGYVIGLANGYKTTFSIFEYVKKRLLRLYPIYLVAILITILFFIETIKSIIGTLFFIQNLFTDVIYNNNPLWSINHEIIYYLLAIPILKLNIKPLYVYFFLITALAASLLKLRFPYIIEGYLVGFFFWFTGFTLSKLKNSLSFKNISADKMIALFFFLLCCDNLNTFGYFLSKINVIHGQSYHYYDDMVNFNDFGIYLYCLYAISVATSVNEKWLRGLTIIVYIFSWSHLLYIIYNKSFFKTEIFYIPCTFLFISTILFFNKKIIFKSISFWSYLGSISFAMYVIHMPILMLFERINFFSGSTSTFVFRVIIIFILVFILSYILEKKIQPFIKSRMSNLPEKRLIL